MHFKILLCLLVSCISFCSSTSELLAQAAGAEGEESVELKIAKAKETFRFLRSEFEDAERLYVKGRTSKQEFRLAKYRMDIATIDLALLELPDQQSKHQLLGAKITKTFRDQELAQLSRLYQKGSVSKLKYSRAVTHSKVAGLAVEYFQAADDEETQSFLTYKINQARFNQAETENDIAKQLYEKSAINKSTYERFRQKRRLAKNKMDESLAAIESI